VDPDDARYYAVIALSKICAGVEFEGSGIESVSFGPPPPHSQLSGILDFYLQLVGKRLCYTASTRDGALNLAAANADSVDVARKLLIALPPDQWQVAARLILALERSGKSDMSEHPLEIGRPPGPDCWVIE